MTLVQREDEEAAARTELLGKVREARAKYPTLGKVAVGAHLGYKRGASPRWRMFSVHGRHPARRVRRVQNGSERDVRAFTPP